MMSTHAARLRLLITGIAFLVPLSLYGQVAEPAPPAEYDAHIRFRIRTPMPAWLDRFDEMHGYLKTLGFQRDARPNDEPEDPIIDRLSGTIPSANARKALLHSSVRSILLIPRGWKLPASTDRVRASLELATGLPIERQKVLSDQCRERLAGIGFNEAVGYDHRGHSRLVGTIEIYRLGYLLRDLRTQPGGWMMPETPVGTLPDPIRGVVPVKVVEVLPDPPGVAAITEWTAPGPLPEDQQHLGKLSPDLRAYLAAEKDIQKRIRVEIVLGADPGANRAWERDILVSGAVVEGRAGPIVAVLARVGQVPDLARLSRVSNIRLPRPGSPQGAIEAPKPNPAVMSGTRLDRLHQLGFRGKGVRVAVVAGDFSGLDAYRGKGLPKDTRVIDLTAERNPSFEPDPQAEPGNAIGHGTACALAVAAAAPDADLILIRIDPSSPQMLLALMKRINGEQMSSETLIARSIELNEERDELANRRQLLNREKQDALRNLLFDEGGTEEQKKRYQASRQRLKDAEAALVELDTREASLVRRTDRFFAYQTDLAYITGIRVVACPLVWNEGLPLDGGSPLSRYLDDTPFRGSPGTPMKTRIAALRDKRFTLWVQSAGDTRGQTWSGPIRDDDNNGVLEFAPAKTIQGPGRWTREWNFLGWQPTNTTPVADLPGESRIRVTIQWREAHDPELWGIGTDLYEEPLANLNIVVAQQRDPSGKLVASDDMTVVARSTGLPQRLANRPNSAVYEQMVEFSTQAAGRFAVRIEGRLPDGIRPRGISNLPTQRVQSEIRPRLFIQRVDAAGRGKGRPVFLDFAGDDRWPCQEREWPEYGGVGAPADARGALTIGVADAGGKPAKSSSVGAGPGLDLMAKPDLISFADIGLPAHTANGSAIAASFSAGIAACMIGADAPAQTRHLLQLLEIPPGGLFRVPENWLNSLPLRSR